MGTEENEPVRISYVGPQSFQQHFVLFRAWFQLCMTASAELLAIHVVRNTRLPSGRW